MAETSGIFNRFVQTGDLLNGLFALIARTVDPDSPVLVEYEATAYCKTFGAIVFKMIQRGKTHQHVVNGKKASRLNGRSSLYE